MGVSSQTTPFNPSPHSFYWVSKDSTRSFSSIIPLPSRSCSHSSRATIYRQEVDIHRGPYGPSPYNNLSLQLRMYRSTFHTKQSADANRFSYMSWSPPCKHPIQSKSGNPASSFGWNYSKVGQSLVAEEDVLESKDDHLSLDDPTISNSCSRPVVSDSERRDWSLARNIIKKSKIEVSKEFNGVSPSSKINSLRIGGAPPSQHMNVNYPVHGQTLGWPDEACNKDQACSEKAQDATSKVLHVNGSSLSSSGNKSEKEKQEKQLSKVIPSYNVNEIDEEIVMDADQSCLEPMKDGEEQIICQQKLRTRLCSIYDRVLVVDKISSARNAVSKLMNQYRHLVHACDTEVSRIDVKQETPVDHGEITCFSIYSGEGVDFGNGKSCIWVDVLDGGGKDLLLEFAPFFADSSIKKVWHNYSFDSHIIENYGIKLSGFHADTMHMARLWDSSRRTEGGYSLEALTGDQKLMSRNKLQQDEDLIGKISMKTIFGRRKVKKDGSLGKIITIPPIEELQREDRKPWICYSSLDSISTFKLYESLKYELSTMPWKIDGTTNGYMLDFYANYWQPFGELLMQMETEGMLVDREYLREMENLATAEQQAVAGRFCNWASRYCPDARYMNPRSNVQLRHLFFGGIPNSKNPDECLPNEKTFRVPNVDKVIEEGKKSPTKFRNISLHKIGGTIKTDLYTATGWPSVSGDALRILAGKVSAEYDFGTDAYDFESVDSSETVDEAFNTSAYGTAFAAFGEGREGIEACHAVAALCEVCSIDSLISNFILPLQGSHVAGKNGRVHCSLNINTETGRLSARRPNLQNQPALEKDRYKIRQAFIASPGKSLIVADYGQLELRILAHLADCKSMKEAFKAGGDFHSRTAMNMYPYISEAVKQKQVLLEWHPLPGQDKPPVPLLKDTFASERRKAKMLNFSIAYGKTPVGLARDWKVSVKEARETVDLWYKDRKEVRKWQEERKKEAVESSCVYTLLGRARRFPSITCATSQQQRGHIERAAINTPVQGSAADVAMCAMLKLSDNKRLNELGWKLLLQVHDEVILEGPTESAEEAKSLVVKCMSKPFKGAHILDVDLVVDAKCAQNWYSAK